MSCIKIKNSSSERLLEHLWPREINKRKTDRLTSKQREKQRGRLGGKERKSNLEGKIGSVIFF